MNLYSWTWTEERGIFKEKKKTGASCIGHLVHESGSRDLSPGFQNEIEENKL